jgi:F0F1-type ATP synthase epsilon subunit
MQQLSEQRIFNCVVIAPSGKILDCQTPSVVFPAHDGQRGVLYNHMPMFCKLGFGIMEVKSALLDDQQLQDLFLLVDGGFVVVCLNLLKVTSYDVVFPTKGKPEVLENIISSISKKLASSKMNREQSRYLTKKISLLKQLLEHI